MSTSYFTEFPMHCKWLQEKVQFIGLKKKLKLEALQSANVLLWLPVKPVSLFMLGKSSYRNSHNMGDWLPGIYCFWRPWQLWLLEALDPQFGTLCCWNLAVQYQEWQLCLAWKPCAVINLSITEPPIWNYHKTCPEGSWSWIQMGIFPSLADFLFFSESTQVTLFWSASRL